MLIGILLTLNIIVCLGLIGVVLLQRSEGGGLGMGGGGGGVVSSRGVATALSKLTWIFAIAFIGTSITLTILATRSADQGSVADQIGTTAPATGTEAPATGGALPTGTDLLPPPAADAPAAPPAAEN